MKFLLLILSFTVSKYDQKRFVFDAVPMATKEACEAAETKINHYLYSHPHYESNIALVDCVGNEMQEFGGRVTE